MNKILTSALLLFTAISPALAQTASQLPVTNVNGRNYYVYQVSGDESLFGIAKKFGWDDNLLAEQNPGAASNLKKGRKLYYPAPDNSASSVASAATPSAASSSASAARSGQNGAATQSSAATDGERTEIFYTATDTTDPYKIAKRLGISTDELYALNPNAKRGINRGDMLRARVTPQIADSLQEKGEQAYTVVERKIGEDTIQVSSSPSLVKKRNIPTEPVRKPDEPRIVYAEQPASEPTSELASEPASELASEPASEPVEAPTLELSAGTVGTPSAGTVGTSAVGAFSAETADTEGEHFRSSRNPLIGLDESALMQYIIQESDDLLTVAKNYNTTIRDIFFLNPAVSDTYFPADEIIRLLPGSRDKDRQTVAVHSRVKTGSRNYKAKKGDTYASIASSNGISEQELREANIKLKEVKKGKTVAIPLYKDVTEWKDSVMTDPRELTAAGRKEIYREVRKELYTASEPRHDYEAVIVTSTASDDRNREKDFLRGFLMGVNTLRTGDRTIGLKVLPTTSVEIPDLLDKMKDSRPDIIFASFESEFPEQLIRFGRENNITVVNTFDAKSTGYEDNHNLVQVLIPSADMNRKIADELMRMSEGKNVVFVADDASDKDSFSSFFKEKLRKANRIFADYPTAASLTDFRLDAGKGYLFVTNLTKRSEIRNCLEYIGALIKEDPTLDVITVGRPTWITIADSQDKQLAEANTYIPSRFYINNDDSDYILFNSNYKSFYNEEPIRSFPAYAPLGYDVARYFLNALLSGGDLENATHGVRNIEMDFRLTRPDENAGLVNENMFFINYTPSGLVRKVNF